MNKTVLTSFTISCLLSTVFLMGLSFNIQPVKATGTICIRADGRIDPPIANITSVDNVTYYFTDNNYDSIAVERSNIIIDGNGYTLQGNGSGSGFSLTSINNVTIKNVNFKNFYFCVTLSYSSSNILAGNNMTTNGFIGINLVPSSNNSIYGNNIINNYFGIWLAPQSSDNKFYHNNFVNNTQHVYFFTLGFANSWDNGYPSGGNYWSDHICFGNPSNGSQPYTIDNDNIDRYPFQDPNGWLGVHNIDTGLDYATIQEAIDANETLDGHTIFVEEGIYYENVVVNKTVSLIGENRSTTIIDGKNRTDTINVVTIDSSNVTINGFSIRNSYRETGVATLASGIRLGDSSNCTISGNIIYNNAFGMRLSNSSSNMLFGNNVTGNDYGIHLVLSSDNSLYGNNVTHNVKNGVRLVGAFNNDLYENILNDNRDGIDLWYADNNVIYSNVVMGNGVFGIELSESSNNLISGNNVNANNDNGINFYRFCNFNSISENNITNNQRGIGLYESCNFNSISKNYITVNDYDGIYLAASSHNSVFGNYIANNYRRGVGVTLGDFNSISENNIVNNSDGVAFLDSINNTFHHNNLIGNTDQVYIIASANFWDAGYPSGGNYWSDHTRVDSDHDGIGDTPYIIDTHNTDNYPLMGMFSDFNATSEHSVQTICNSSISDFQFNGTAIIFNVSGEDETTGFCRICVSTALIPNEPDTYYVYVNGSEVPHTLLPFSNSTHSYLYFNYTLSTKEVVIIPEFPSLIVLPLLMIFTFVVVALSKKKRPYMNKQLQ